MTILGSKLRSLALACAAVIVVGSLTFILVLLALRPFNLAGMRYLSSPEIWLAAMVAAGAMLVCTWRLARGGSAQEELELFEKAASGDDHLG